LDRLIEEDRGQAREGMVRLLGEDGEVSHKHVDELSPEDVPARRRAETAMMDFLMRRTERRFEIAGRPLPLNTHTRYTAAVR
jgi:hypothetical protein